MDGRRSPPASIDSISVKTRRMNSVAREPSAVFIEIDDSAYISTKLLEKWLCHCPIKPRHYGNLFNTD